MKGLKILLFSLSLIFVAVIHANAAIVWLNTDFNYEVESNGGTTIDFGSGANPSFGGDTGSGDLPNSHFVSYDEDSLTGMVADAGARGGTFENGGNDRGGAFAQGYARIIPNLEGQEAAWGVSQIVHSANTRSLKVTEAGYYDLIGTARGLINYTPVGDETSNPRALSTLEGGVTLDRVIEIPGGQDITNLASFSWGQLLTAGGTDALEVLLTPGVDKHYELKVGFGTLSSYLLNFSTSGGGTITGPLPGPYDLGLPGSDDSTGETLFANALGLQGELVHSHPVPIPGSVVLLLSGVTALIGLRRRNRSS